MYIEKIFPSKNIRYIAVNDNIDTFDKRNANNDITPFKAVINDMYAKDTSNKVRSTIITKAMDGQCIKAFLPYGYRKDKIDKNRILVDYNVSDNIKLIFDLYKSGKTKTEIANRLNELEISTPLKYKQETTKYYNPNSKATYKWNSTSISKILRNQIYVGDLIQLQHTKVNYKIKKITAVPKEEQIVILNNHEAIIDRSTFNTVQKMLDRKANEWNYSNKKKHLLTGLVFCKCGSRITYNKNHGIVFRCVCSSYKKYGNKFCSSIHLKEAELLEMVANSLKQNIKSYLKIKDLKYTSVPVNDNNTKKIEKLANKKHQISKIIGNLYEDKTCGSISIETFEMLIKKYEKDMKELDMQIERMNKLNKNIQEIKLTNRQLEEKINYLLECDTINEENKSLVFKLIDKIIIDDDKISIEYKFNNLNL